MVRGAIQSSLAPTLRHRMALYFHYAWRFSPPLHSHVCWTPWSVFQDGSDDSILSASWTQNYVAAQNRSTDWETRTASSPHPLSQHCALPPRLKDVRFYNLGAGDKRLVHGASNENHCWPPYRTRARLLSLHGTHADQVRSKVPRGLNKCWKQTWTSRDSPSITPKLTQPPLDSPTDTPY